jgi:hypothetical protein
MGPANESVQIAMRIPGAWNHPGELIERLPEGCRLTQNTLTLADGTEIEFDAMGADDQFAEIFRTSCRNLPEPEEAEAVENYKVNILLGGPGGSLAQAHTMMRAAAAIMHAGGAGVFIDNCMLAHGATAWQAMTDDGSPDAISFALVSIMSSDSEVWTIGMHTIGLRDVLMKRSDCDEFDIVEVIRYCAGSEKRIDHGHVLADLSGPRFQAFAQESPADHRKSPLHNPWGRLRLVSMKDISNAN